MNQHFEEIRVRFSSSFGLIVQGDSQSNDPVAYDNGVTYMFVQHSNVYLMIASRQNCNAASLLFFLHRVVDVSKFFSFSLKVPSFFRVFDVMAMVIGFQALLRGVRRGIIEG